MSDTTFIDKITVIEAPWLNDVNDTVYGLPSNTGTALVTGTWFGGVIAALSSLASSTGSALIGFIQTGTGASARSLQSKLREINTPADRGAVGDNVTNDTTAIQNTAAYLDYHLPKATGYSVNVSVPIPSTTYGTARGRQAPVNITGTAGLRISGSTVVLKDHRLNGPASTQLISASASASDVRINGVDLSSDATAAPNGIGVQVNQSNSGNWSVEDSTFNVYNYGVLLNTTAGGSKGFVVSRNHINTQVGDLVAVNSPSTAIEDVVIGSNVGSVAAGTGSVSGFGMSFAHVNGASIYANILQRSYLEAIHIEDGSKNITVVGNVAKNCLSDGLRHIIGGTGSNQAQTKSLTAVGNQFEAASIIAGSSGMRVVYDTNGTPYSDTFVGNVVRNFENGLWLGGNSTHFVNGNVIDSCTYAMRCETGRVTYTRITGTNHVVGAAATALLYVSDVSGTGTSVRAGKFVCENSPTNIILKSAPGTTRPGCSVDGFSWPTTLANTAGVNSYKNLFPAASTNRFEGKITTTGHDRADIANNTWYSANILWDGATLTISNVISEYNGALAMTAPALRVSGGQLQAGFFDAAAITIDIFMNFDGIYMA